MKILFVCTGNTCRSPMAEALAKKIFPQQEFQIFSAGIGANVGEAASENAIIVAKENGLDLSAHKATQISAKSIEDADIVLTMTGGHKHAIAAVCNAHNTPVFTLSEYAGGEKEISDPYGCDTQAYRECMAVLKEYIEKVYQILK